MLSFFLGLWIGGIVGIVVMCLLQVGRNTAEDEM